MTEALLDRLGDVRRLAMSAGAVALIAAGLAAWLVPRTFLVAWLITFMFWLGLSLGALGLLMLQHLSGGLWGLVARRPLEAAAGALPLLAVAFVPIALGAGELYAWARPEAAADPVLVHKRAYLNVPFFLVRASLYFAVWIALAAHLASLSSRQDREWTPGRARHIRRVSAGGLVVYVLTMTLASTDWVMSLEPHWFSTIFGPLVIAGQGVLALSFAILLTGWLSSEPPLAPLATAERFHDFGNLLLAFVMLWAYFAFSQYLVIWSEDLPEEITWYLHRSGWEWLAVALVVLHFAVPFLVLLSRRAKQHARTLMSIAAGLVVMRVAELAWLVAPGLEARPLAFAVLTPVCWFGLGCLWAVVCFARLRARPLVPVGDPELVDAIRNARVAHG